jgi:hypothetical protein
LVPLCLTRPLMRKSKMKKAKDLGCVPRNVTV